MSTKRVRTPPNFEAIVRSLKSKAPEERIEQLRRHEELQLTADLLAEGYRDACTDAGRMAVLNGISGAEVRAQELDERPHVERDKKSQAQRQVASQSASQQRKQEAMKRKNLARALAQQVSSRIHDQGKAAVARSVQDLAKKSGDADAESLSKLTARRLITLIFD